MTCIKVPAGTVYEDPRSGLRTVPSAAAIVCTSGGEFEPEEWPKGDRRTGAYWEALVIEHVRRHGGIDGSMCADPLRHCRMLWAAVERLQDAGRLRRVEGGGMLWCAFEVCRMNVETPGDNRHVRAV